MHDLSEYTPDSLNTQLLVWQTPSKAPKIYGPEKQCTECGGTFRSYKGITCSKKCMGARFTRLHSVICVCKHCNNNFTIRKSEVEDGRGKYCSPDCFFEGQKHEFSADERALIASEWEKGESSSAIANRLGVGKQVLSGYLKQIGLFEKRYRAGSSHAKWKGGASFKGDKSKSFRIKRNNACEECKYCKVPQVLEIHHINRNRRDNTDANLRLLCPNCHAEAHYNSHTGVYTRHGGSARG